MPEKLQYDVIIVGAGHNALVAACYLAKAKLSVLVLEKQDHTGGATVSAKIFPGMDAWPSQYSYLVSLLPDKIIKDLNLNFILKRRSVASYTPYEDKALLISNVDEKLTKESFVEFAGEREYKKYKKFSKLESIFAQKVWPTMLEKIPSKNKMKSFFKTPKEIESWDLFVEKPLGYAMEKYFSNDLVRGLIFTDAKIGILTYPDDPRFYRIELLYITLSAEVQGNGEYPLVVWVRL